MQTSKPQLMPRREEFLDCPELRSRPAMNSGLLPQRLDRSPSSADHEGFWIVNLFTNCQDWCIYGSISLHISSLVQPTSPGSGGCRLDRAALRRIHGRLRVQSQYD